MTNAFFALPRARSRLDYALALYKVQTENRKREDSLPITATGACFTRPAGNWCLRQVSQTMLVLTLSAHESANAYKGVLLFKRRRNSCIFWPLCLADWLSYYFALHQSAPVMLGLILSRVTLMALSTTRKTVELASCRLQEALLVRYAHYARTVW